MSSGNSKTHATALVIIPPAALWPSIQAIRQEHDRNARRWMPHITLIYPFRPRKAFESLIEPLSRLCETVEPFEVTLAEFRLFRHRQEGFTLYLAPEPREALVRLQATLNGAVPDCDDVTRHAGGFTPHLSVGQVRGSAPALRLQAALQAAWQPVSFAVREVGLIWRNDPPDDIFRVAHSVGLGRP
jgi:2'-5' RNA ligase